MLPVLRFVRFGSGYTALHVAAAEGSAEMCSLLIDGGADVNAEATG